MRSSLSGPGVYDWINRTDPSRLTGLVLRCTRSIRGEPAWSAEGLITGLTTSSRFLQKMY